ncbi:Fc.00g082150.m01.CDS01 [Cosmosporella sp. VM-42]
MSLVVESALTVLNQRSRPRKSTPEKLGIAINLRYAQGHLKPLGIDVFVTLTYALSLSIWKKIAKRPQQVVDFKFEEKFSTRQTFENCWQLFVKQAHQICKRCAAQLQAECSLFALSLSSERDATILYRASGVAGEISLCKREHNLGKSPPEGPTAPLSASNNGQQDNVCSTISLGLKYLGTSDLDTHTTEHGPETFSDWQNPDLTPPNREMQDASPPNSSNEPFESIDVAPNYDYGILENFEEHFTEPTTAGYQDQWATSESSRSTQGYYHPVPLSSAISNYNTSNPAIPPNSGNLDTRPAKRRVHKHQIPEILPRNECEDPNRDDPHPPRDSATIPDAALSDAGQQKALQGWDLTDIDWQDWESLIPCP